MKLKNVKLKNVLSHKDTDLDIADVVTMITGASESGKSCIIRGLNMLFRNEPAGLTLLRNRVKHGVSAETTATCTDNKDNRFVITRRRGKSKNEYELNEELMKAFGLTVPENIKELLNLSQHAFQLQQEGNFLLSDTDGEVARVLGQTVGLSKIDLAFQYFRKLKSENDKELRTCEGDFKRESDVLVLYEDTDSIVEIYRVADLTFKSFTEKVKDSSSIAELIDALNATPKPVNTTEMFEFLKSAKRKIEKESLLENLTADLFNLIEELCSIPKAIDIGLVPEQMNVAKLKVDKTHSLRKSTDNLSEIIKALSSIPKPVNVSSLKKHVSECSDKKEVLAKKELRISEGKALLNAIFGCPSDGSEELKSIGKDIKNCAERLKKVLEKEKVGYDISTLLWDLSETDIKLKTSAKKVKDALREIDMFMQNNPVCPECGAKQQHWEKTNVCKRP